MRRNYFTGRNVMINSKTFNSDDIKEKLSKFSNDVEDGFLVTRYDGREICKVEISKIYYNFDFSGFSISILDEIMNYFQPESYKLSVASGVQEIRLFGGEIYIDNERYEKMISIINSTDKSRALSMNVGLVKVIKGGTPKSYTILTSFANKHYKSSLPEKIKIFSENLINFNIDIDFHIKTIEDLKNKEVSFVDFLKKIMFKDNGDVLKSVELKVRALGKSLLYNKGFRNEYNTLGYITASKLNSMKDFKINAKVIYDTYVELFKDYDTSVIARESRRIIDAIDKV
jgi:hypothetical protein